MSRTPATRTRPPGELAAYFADVSRRPRVTVAEERRLAGLVAAGDDEARRQLIEANLRLVFMVAKRYAGNGLSLEDLIGYGNIGLVRATEHYDRDLGMRFSTYSVWWIRHMICRALSDYCRAIRIPAYLIETMSHWDKVAARLTDRKGRRPTSRRIAAELGLTDRQTENLKAGFFVRSMAQLHGDRPGKSAVDMLAVTLVDQGRTPEDEAMMADEWRRAVMRLDELNWKEAAVIRLRFGVAPATRPHTLREIGEVVGVTKQRVRQIEAEALENLRRVMAS